MVAFPVVLPTEVGGNLAYTDANAGGDSFPAAAGKVYVLLWRNVGGAAITPTLDDPTSVSPASAKTFNPDVDCFPIPLTSGVTVQAINGTRYRHPTTGNVSITYSATPTGVSCAVLGPFGL